ncbi:MAG: HIT domain-containing protein [Luteolibacter sp.]
MDFYCEQVLSGKLGIKPILETEHVFAFHHTNPYWPVHVVVIPKRHIGSLASLSATDVPIVNEMLAVAAELCWKLTEEYGGCRLSTNCGDHQTTKHLHFYIHSGARLRDEHGNPLPPA